MSIQLGSGSPIFSTAPWLTIIVGHYGVGKTNLSLNIARDLRALGNKVTLIDLDIVNPYFRSTDNRDFVEQRGIRLLGPVHGATNLDTPSLPPGINEALSAAGEGHAVIVDVGGDPDGARALGRYAAHIKALPHRMVDVVNFSRPEMASVKDNLELLSATELTSGLAHTEIVGNTHLKNLTTAELILASVAPTIEFSQQAHLPLAGITAPRALVAELEALLAADIATIGVPVYPVDVIVGTSWEDLTT
ncbi:MAG: hypothetical protein LBI64_02855 [Coriobacteriales bacterium]|jgi:hypothetical protein|nr:hypothetical protein [Coriobacteriales bacterium]